MHVLAWPAVAGLAAALLYFIVQCIARLIEKRWKEALLAFLRFAGLVVSFVVLGLVLMLEPTQDYFADNLTIPEGIEIAEPDPDASDATDMNAANGTDEFQKSVRAALAAPGGDSEEFSPDMPSLRRAATDHAQVFRDYLDASPDWAVFMENGNRFAVRRWSYEGEPRYTSNGYISDSSEWGDFDTRCLICLDGKQWGSYSVQHVEEGSKPVKPKMTRGIGNGQPESRVMIQCGGVWVEIFEQSGKPERRVTKATVSALEKEFAEFEKSPEAALAGARARSSELANRISGKDRRPFRLLTDSHRGPGFYGVDYLLNPGEPGSVYLKAFEVTKGTPLSDDRLKKKSLARITGSADSAERFYAKAELTIYEGDWGKPYAARFEVWFKPDSGKGERKLAERIFKIEGWQE